MLTRLFLDQLEREAPRTRRVLENVPTGKDDWKPHPKSMSLLQLAGLVAAMPSWISYIIKLDELDVAPAEGKGQYQPPPADGLVKALDKAVSEGQSALAGTTDDFLLTTSWKLLARGQVVAEPPRHVVIADTFGHLGHHRGQLTVYLRLLGSKVPSTYGPTADDQLFG